MTTTPRTPSGTNALVSRRQLFALAGGAAVLAACSGSSATSVDSTAADASTTDASTSTLESTTTSTIPATTTTVPVPVQPLTGLPLTDETLLSKVAVIVKVSNDRGARPQTGLNDADIVFEAWGAGPTRFAAIFHSGDNDFVGPVRSCREQDVNLVGEFNRAVFACSGGNKATRSSGSANSASAGRSTPSAHAQSRQGVAHPEAHAFEVATPQGVNQSSWTSFTNARKRCSNAANAAFQAWAEMGVEDVMASS